MCLIFLAFRHHPRYPLYLMANRDEFYQRPTMGMHWWEDTPGLLAGKDLQGGGTWMGFTPQGDFAALTNIRAPGQMKPDAPSRGELVTGFLRHGRSPAAYAAQVAKKGAAYSGFNLLVGNAAEIWFVSNGQAASPRLLAPGIYGLSNASLDTPWPKVAGGKTEFSRLLSEPQPDPEALFGMMQRKDRAPDAQLPDTGVPLKWERLLSARYIASETYGTRLTTRLCVNYTGAVEVEERSFYPAAPPRHFQFHLHQDTP